MSEGQPSQPVIIVASTKGVGIAIILALLFGPLGLLYSSVLAAVVMFIVSIPVVIFTAGLGLLLTQPICAVWAAVAVMSRNKKLVEGATGSLTAAPPTVRDVVASSPTPTEVPWAAQPSAEVQSVAQALPCPSSDSMFCAVCGTEGAEGSKYCGECGGQMRPAPKELEAKPAEAAVVGSLPSIATGTLTAQEPLGAVSSTPMYCPDCGSEIAEGRQFCGKCGRKLSAAAVAVMWTAPSEQRTAAAVAPARETPKVFPASPAPKSFVAKITPLVFLVVLAAAGGAWWWFNRPVPAYKVQDPGIYPFQGLSADGTTIKTGFIDADGKVVVQPEWDACSRTTISHQLVACNEGLCGVYKDGKWGYIDTTGHLVIPNQFDFANPFTEGLATVKLGGRWGFIDKTGQYVINPQFDKFVIFHEGLAPVHVDGNWGYIDRTGSFAFKSLKQMNPAAEGGDFSGGLAAVCQNAPQRCGYIDRSGTLAIKPQFDSASTFSEGLASVLVSGKWGYINTSGKIVINPQFDGATAFSGGLAIVSISGHQGTINRQGRFVVNPGQFNIETRDGDLQPVSGSDGLGLITRDGKWVVKPTKAITEIESIFGKVFEGKINGQTAPISLAGKVLAGPYKGAMLDTLAPDIDNENSARDSVSKLIARESSYNAANPANGFTSDLGALGKSEGSAEVNGADQIDAALASGTKDGYQFTITIPVGTSTGGINFNYFLVAKPATGHAGRTFCADSSGTVRYAMQGAECMITSPTL